MKNLVKGLSKRVVVVRFPETRAFEEAIFVLREERSAGVTQDELIREASGIAEEYTGKPVRRRRLPPLLYLLSGAASTGLIWLVTMLIK